MVIVSHQLRVREPWQFTLQLFEINDSLGVLEITDWPDYKVLLWNWRHCCKMFQLISYCSVYTPTFYSLITDSQIIKEPACNLNINRIFNATFQSKKDTYCVTWPQGAFCNVTVNLLFLWLFAKIYWHVPRNVKIRPSKVVKCMSPVTEHSAKRKECLLRFHFEVFHILRLFQTIRSNLK